MLKRLFIVIAVCVCSIAVYAADKNKYDGLINQCSSWSDKRILQVADRVLAKGDKERALVLYMVVCNRMTVDMDDSQASTCALAHVKSGDIYFQGGNYSNALDFYVKGMKVSDSNEKKPYLAVLYKNIGNVYSMFQDYEKGISLYLEGVKMAKESGDNETLYKLYQNLTGAYIYLNDTKTARYYHNLSQRTSHPRTDVSQFMDGFTLALLIKAEGNYTKAIDKFSQLSKYAKTKHLPPHYECSTYEEIYKLYKKMGNNDSTILYLDKCRKLAEEKGLIHMFIETFRHLADIYECSGNVELSLRMKSKYLSLKDSVFNMRQFDIVKNQQFLYEMGKTQQEIAMLHEEEARRAQVISWQRLVIICFTATIIVVLLFLIYVSFQKKKLNQSYRDLYQLNRQLTARHIEVTEMHRDMQEKDRLKDDEIKQLRRQVEKLTNSETAETEEEPKPEEELEPVPAVTFELSVGAASKYKKSTLTDEQRSTIAQSIVDVMENSLEYCKPDFSLDMLAELVGSNSKYVSQVINEVYGKNFSNYVNEYRVRLACMRLSDLNSFGNYTVKAIGESVGYKVYGTFINVFKKATGITPSMYQKLTLEEANMA